MNIFKLSGAAAAACALAIVSFGTAAAARPQTGGDFVLRAERSPNPKDVFVRTVKVPRPPRDQSGAAMDRPCPMIARPSAPAGAALQP